MSVCKLFELYELKCSQTSPFIN